MGRIHRREDSRGDDGDRGDRSASAASRWPDLRRGTAARRPQRAAHATCYEMPSLSIHTLCLVTLVLRNIYGSVEHEITRRSSLSRRAIDGTRGRKYFDPEEGDFDSYGSAGGQYDPYEEKTDFSDIRRNVPGEPGIDYPTYTTLPQTGFTCEGRSRGYYADQVAGCQVFHVCHDVLVSSFLCPMGSVFSQKLLTCDWWTKVDCSSSAKYMDVNRNSYQQDDDEMIRNAYAMISLQSGTDLTKDGLVDPDRTGSLLDYQQGTRRILDYATMFTAGNDLRSNAQDYPSRDSLLAYEFQRRRPYQQQDLYSGEKLQPRRFPLQRPPMLQKIPDFRDYDVDDQGKSPRFQISSKLPTLKELKNHFQPSYAPTVPTVTTTTRRFYSPTVPTTFRPSTFAYNNLDQLTDSSDYLFTRSRTTLDSFVTPPTSVFNSGHGASKESQSNPYNPLRIHEFHYHRDYDYARKSAANGGQSGERFGTRLGLGFQSNRTLFHQTYRPFNDGTGRREEDLQFEESAEDIETKDSVGLVHALRQPLNHSWNLLTISDKATARGRIPSSAPNDSSQTGSLIHAGSQHTLPRPESTASSEEQEEDQGTTEQYQAADDTDTLLASTIPPLDETTTEESSIGINSSSNSADLNVEEKYPLIDTRLHRPVGFFKAPKFQIKVPDVSPGSSLLIRYSTLNTEPDADTRTTESPRFRATDSEDYVNQPTSGNEKSGVIGNYVSREPPKSFTPQEYRTTASKSLVSSTGSWSSSSSSSSSFSEQLLSRDYSNSSNPLNASNASIPSVTRTTETFIPAGIDRTIKPTTLSPSSSYLAKCRTVTDAFNGTPISLTAKTNDLECPEALLRPTTERSSEKFSAMPEKIATDGEFTGAPTTDDFLSSIGLETLKEIEESIDRNNSPYKVTLTLDRDEELAPDGGDLIGKLIARQGKQSSTFNKLEIVKSVEAEVQHKSESNLQDAVNILGRENTNHSNGGRNITDIIKSEDSEKQNLNTLSLLQLMSELLKLDRAPRPFAFNNAHRESFPVETIDKHVNLSTELKEGSSTTIRPWRQSSTESLSKASLSKEQILDRLTENFGEPLRGIDERLDSRLAETERCLDSGAGFPRSESSSRCQDSSGIESTLSTTTSSEPRTTAAVVTTPTPKSILTTESVKTVVKTEFLPSIGFSFDTDRDRKEYVEAVLGGLIEPQLEESRKIEDSESPDSELSEQSTFSSKDTSGRNQDTNGHRGR